MTRPPPIGGGAIARLLARSWSHGRGGTRGRVYWVGRGACALVLRGERTSIGAVRTSRRSFVAGHSCPLRRRCRRDRCGTDHPERRYGRDRRDRTCGGHVPGWFNSPARREKRPDDRVRSDERRRLRGPDAADPRPCLVCRHESRCPG